MAVREFVGHGLLRRQVHAHKPMIDRGNDVGSICGVFHPVGQSSGVAAADCPENPSMMPMIPPSIVPLTFASEMTTALHALKSLDIRPSFMSVPRFIPRRISSSWRMLSFSFSLRPPRIPIENLT